MPFVSSREPLILNDEEVRYLEKLVRSRNTKAGISLRAKIILMSNQGISDSSIARQLGISRHKVIRTISRVLKIGIQDGLNDFPGTVYNGPIEQSDRLILNSEDDLSKWYERTVENFVKNGQ